MVLSGKAETIKIGTFPYIKIFDWEFILEHPGCFLPAIISMK
jgi:hypothetical protein